VFFYKRAQIFVGDVHGALGGKGLGEFTDMEQLTMFADYRVGGCKGSCNSIYSAYNDVTTHIAAIITQLLACPELVGGSSCNCRLKPVHKLSAERNPCSYPISCQVPVVLRSMGILAYSPDLEQHIASKQQVRLACM
jgi:hypothetical protein